MGIPTDRGALASLLLVCCVTACSFGPGWGRGGGGASAAPSARTQEVLLSRVRQLTFEGQRAGEGYFGPDGRSLVFQSEREPGNPFYQIYRMDLATGDVRRVSPGSGKTTCGWIHPDGMRVLFASTHHDPQARAEQEAELAERASGRARRYAWDFDAEYELYERHLGTDGLRRLTHARGYDAEGSWSPDGRSILFASNRHAYAGSLAREERERFEADPSVAIDLYRMNADGSEVRRLTTAPGYDGGPFFSADGSRIVWRRFSPEGDAAEIFTMDADGGGEQRLTRLGALSWAPYFHPSGDYVVFTTNLEGHRNFELYLADAAGESEPVRVTYSDGFDGLPAFSPDGTLLGWTSGRAAEGGPQIFLADWDDAAARRLLGLAPSANGRAVVRRLEQPSTVEASPEALRAHVVQLTSEEMEGRLTGTEGERLATAYVAEVMRELGLEPEGETGGFFEEFEFTAGVSLAPSNRLEIAGGADGATREPAVDVDWRPLGFSRVGEAGPAAVVFAGYGIVAPADEDVGPYDAYADLDVTDRWVLVLRGFPENVSEEARHHWRRYASLRHKAMLARDRGALGLIVATGPRSKVRRPLIPLRLDGSAASTRIAVLSVSQGVAEEILAPWRPALAELHEELDRGQRVAGFEVPGVSVTARVALRLEKQVGRNVLGRLRAGAASGRPALVIGAHVDHLGRGSGGTSLAQGDERGGIHYGADDNASGVASVLEIAKQLVAEQREGTIRLARDVLFAAWSGEELGLLGAEHFVRARAGPDEVGLSDSVAAYLNLDMVGRLEKRLVLQGIGSSSSWRAEIERLNASLGLPIAVQEQTYLPTDATAFYLKRVPFLNAFTGAHAEYHTPRDTADTLDYEGLARITALVTRLARDLATRPEAPDYVVATQPPSGPGRADLRATLGTIPDYVESDADGLRLSGVIEGGPAARAGLRAGDVVVELAGRTIENIYDYTYAIEGLKVGEPVDVVVKRGGARLTLTLTPEPRE